MANPVKLMLGLNPRFAPCFAKTMLGTPRASDEAEAFAAHVESQGFEFTASWADENIPFIAPVLRRLAVSGATLSYLEVGAYEGRNLAFMDWLLPGQLQVTAIDPWFHKALNPEDKYHAIEPRFWRNAKKLHFPYFSVRKGFSTYELPTMLKAGETFDVIYIDGSHTAWAVMTDLCYCAALLQVGGLMILDDYWHEESEIGGPGVKQAVDRFHGIFHDYFEPEAVYRQVVLRKTADFRR